MRYSLFVLVSALFFTACDDARVYEDYTDLENGLWPVQQKPAFEFVIADASLKYNLYANVRNAVSYPESRLFFQYALTDSLLVLQKQLIPVYLFDQKTGEPFGSSALGDIYDHQVLLLKDFTFAHPGKYKFVLEQYTRQDTLQGILAVGLRVEKGE